MTPNPDLKNVIIRRLISKKLYKLETQSYSELLCDY